MESVLTRLIAPVAAAGLPLGVAIQFLAVEQRVAAGDLVAGDRFAQSAFFGVLLLWTLGAIVRLWCGRGRILTTILALFCLGVYVGLPLVLALLGKRELDLWALEYVARALITVSGLTALVAAWTSRLRATMRR